MQRRTKHQQILILKKLEGLELIRGDRKILLRNVDSDLSMRQIDLNFALSIPVCILLAGINGNNRDGRRRR